MGSGLSKVAGAKNPNGNLNVVSPFKQLIQLKM